MNDTYETNGHSYEINHILENFNVFSFGNVTGSHINGAIIAGGGVFKIPSDSIDTSIPKWNGTISDDGLSVSDFKDPVPRNYSYIKGSYKTVRGFNLLDKLYVGKDANDGITNDRLLDKQVIFTDDYVDWSLAKESLQEQSVKMLNNAERNLTIDDIYKDAHDVPYIIIKENDNVRIPKEIFDKYDYVVYASEGKPFDTDRIVLNYDVEGTVQEKLNVYSNDEEGLKNGSILMSTLLHSLAYDGYHPEGPYVTGPEKTINIFHNYPYATNLINLNSGTQRFGQLVAVNATVYDLLGNINGNMIVDALYSHNSEPHFWPPGQDFDVEPGVKLYEISGIKIDENDQTPLSKAIITLFDKDKNIISTTSTDDDGLFVFKNLKEGTYIVKETKAPEGYELGDNAVTVTVNEERKIVPLVFKNKKFEDEIPRVSLYSIKGYKVDSDTKKGLSGAEITLYDQKENILSVAYTDDSGFFEFEDLKDGTYLVKETIAPQGYLLGMNVSTVTFNEQSDVIIELMFENKKLEPVIPQDNHYVIKGYKFDDRTKKALEGAEITLYDDHDNVLKTVITDEVGYFEFHNLTEGLYIVAETNAPKGYYLGNNRVEVTVTKDHDHSTIMFENRKIEELPNRDGEDPKPKDSKVPKDPNEEKSPVDDKFSTPSTGIKNYINSILYISLITASLILLALLKKRKRMH